jgi:hypothetical protein
MGKSDERPQQMSSSLKLTSLPKHGAESGSIADLLQLCARQVETGLNAEDDSASSGLGNCALASAHGAAPSTLRGSRVEASGNLEPGEKKGEERPQNKGTAPDASALFIVGGTPTAFASENVKSSRSGAGECRADMRPNVARRPSSRVGASATSNGSDPCIKRS